MPQWPVILRREDKRHCRNSLGLRTQALLVSGLDNWTMLFGDSDGGYRPRQVLKQGLYGALLYWIGGRTGPSSRLHKFISNRTS